jgi:glutamate/aspartate transport system permease protein
MNYNWNWRIFWELSPDATGTYMDTLWAGLGWSLVIALSAWTIALCAGTLVGILRTLPHRVASACANAYIELFRNIPLLVQMFLWYFVMPELVPAALGDWLKSLPNSPLITAIVCLGFFTSARVAVQLSAGIQSLPRGQRMAAQALGMNLPQAYRFVILPMAFRTVIPPLTNEFLNVIKNSAVALTIGVMELTARARAMQEFTFNVFEAFTAATLMYLVVNIIVVNLMRAIERGVAVPGMAAAGGGKHA